MSTPQSVMQTLKGSKNYIWSEGECLGQGASAAVYRGRHKRSGDLCAVKTYRLNGRSQNAESWRKELDLLRNLDHRNVVRVLSIEEETQSKTRVLVMELCSSSVYGMLEEPKFAFGFPETEFITVVSDVGEGMRYLRTNQIVHRDIKPGNIMRVLSDDHRSIYKLADFGAARTLSEDGNFMSLCGTEEYLHPDLYARAVLRQNTGQQFNECVDLWSLGATFYHIATGELPFRPFGGRNNSNIMHEMTNNKRSGMISAYQKVEGGRIFYNDDLPETCLLSFCLKKMLIPMFAGLLENNSAQMWDFERFFGFAGNLKHLVTLKFYDPTFATNRLLYVKKQDTYADLQNVIAEYIEVAVTDQIIVNSSGIPLSDFVNITTPIGDYPQLVMTSQYFVYCNSHVDRMPCDVIDLPEKPNFSSIFQYDRDYELSVQCLGVCYFGKTLVAMTLEAQTLLCDSYSALRSYLLRGIEKVAHTQDMLRTLSRFNQHQCKRWLSLHKNIASLIDRCQLVGEGAKLKQDLYRIVAQINDYELDKEKKIVDRLDRDLRDTKMIVVRTTVNLYNQSCCASDHSCEGTIEHQQDWISKISTRFKRDKATELHSYNDEQIHKMERIKLKERIESVYTKYSEHCQQRLILIHGESFNPIRTLCGLAQRIDHHAADISKQHSLLKSVFNELKHNEKAYDEIQGKLLAILPLETAPVSTKFEKTPSIAKYVADSGFTGEITHSLIQATHKKIDFFLDGVKTAEVSIKNVDILIEQLSLKCGKPKHAEAKTTNSFISKPTMIDVNSIDQNGQTDFMRSCAVGALNKVKSLLKIPDLKVNLPDKTGSTALILACLNVKYDIMAILVKCPDLDVNTQNKNGETALIIASKIGQVGIVGELVSRYDTDANLADVNGMTALLFACRNGRGDILISLLSHKTIDVNAVSNSGHSALTILSGLAPNWEKPEMVKELIRHPKLDLNYTNPEGFTALWLACNRGNVKTVEILLEAPSINVNQSDKDGNTALMYASKSEHSRELLKLLIHHSRVNLNHTNLKGETALVFASAQGHTNAVETLIKSSIDVNLHDKNGETVLMNACKTGNLSTVVLLLKREDLDVNSTDSNGRTALMFASKFGHSDVVNVLRSRHDLNVNVRDKDGHSAKDYEDKRKGVTKKYENARKLENM